jgi:hypothetical protein
MYELKKMERYLRVNLLGPGPRLIKNNLPGRGLTKIEKHWTRPMTEELQILNEEFAVDLGSCLHWR